MKYTCILSLFYTQTNEEKNHTYIKAISYLWKQN